jgi:hypothetical protein
MTHTKALIRMQPEIKSFKHKAGAPQVPVPVDLFGAFPKLADLTKALGRTPASHAVQRGMTCFNSTNALSFAFLCLRRTGAP